MLLSKSIVREVLGITSDQKKSIETYLHGCVYSWCNNNKKEWFSARDFLGRDNYNWGGTPLQHLYDKHYSKGKRGEDCVKAAGKDAGWILKKVIAADTRKFETKVAQRIRQYRWI
jgi:hypothetical protein